MERYREERKPAVRRQKNTIVRITQELASMKPLP